MTDRYRVLQQRGGLHDAGEVVELARTHRYNGALEVRDAQAESARQHFKSHEGPDTVVIGPDDRPDSVTAVMVGPATFRWITTWVEKV